jgi:hypothetical protein
MVTGMGNGLRSAPRFSPLAIANIRECGITWQEDLEGLESGAVTPEELLRVCIGRGPDLSLTGWIDYVDTLRKVLK